MKSHSMLKRDQNKTKPLITIDRVVGEKYSYNKTREDILYKRKQKIDAIIEKAVKRALKFNGGNNNIHKEIFSKPTHTPTTIRTTAPTTSTPIKTTTEPNYSPILNPITGSPIGMVRKEDGKFFIVF